MNIENILIVRLSAIGDVVHTLPCLHALHQTFPNAHIGWLVEELSATLLRGHPDIDELFVIPKKKWRKHPIKTWLNGEQPAFYKKMRQRKWDVAIDFQGLTKSGFPLLLSGAKTRIGFGDKDGRELNKLFTNRRVTPSDQARHVIERNLSLLNPLGIETPPEKVAWRFPDFAQEEADLASFFSEQTPDGFIALYPGAGWESKRWPTQRFAELAKLMTEENSKASVLAQVLVWGPGEETLCKEIIKTAQLPPEKLMIAPPTNLRQLAVLLKKANAVVGGDTGPIHLAAAMNIPIASMYGASDPLRNGPWGPKSRWVLTEETDCKVCWRTKCNHSPFIECLETIPAERLAKEVEMLLEE